MPKHKFLPSQGKEYNCTLDNCKLSLSLSPFLQLVAPAVVGVFSVTAIVVVVAVVVVVVVVVVVQL